MSQQTVLSGLQKRVRALEKALEEERQARVKDVEEWLRSRASFADALKHLIVGSQKEIDRLDLIGRSATYVLKEVFGHQVQVEAYLAMYAERIGGEKFVLPPAEELEKKATEWYHRTFGEAYGQVVTQRKEERARFEADLKAADAVLEARREAAEKKRMEEELKATTGVVAQDTGGPGSDIPIGATVFGGG